MKLKKNNNKNIACYVLNIDRQKIFLPGIWNYHIPKFKFDWIFLIIFYPF